MITTANHVVETRLKREREILGLSRRAMAMRLGMSPSHYAGLEDGTREPSIAMARRVAAQLGIDIDALLADYTGDGRSHESAHA